MKLRYAVTRQGYEIARFNERSVAVEYVLSKRETSSALDWTVFDMAQGEYGKRVY